MLRADDKVRAHICMHEFKKAGKKEMAEPAQWCGFSLYFPDISIFALETENPAAGLMPAAGFVDGLKIKNRAFKARFLI